VSAGDHLAERPSWDCGCCGRPWPCDPAREQLAAEAVGPTYLTMWMSVEMVHAARENPAILPSELYERFLAWTGLRSVS
jgi:hypothetical protein